MTPRDLRNACLAVAVLLAACSSGRVTGDASTTGGGDATGSAGTGGGGGDSGGGGLDGGGGGAAGNAGTGGGGGTGRGGTGGDGTGGGGGTVSGDAGTTACGDAAACTASQVCLRTVIGGASYVCPDAGHVTFPSNCDGLIVDMYGCCYGAETSIYRCAARPSGCGAAVTCACAASTLCTSGTCSEPGASEIVCLQSGV